MTNNTKDRLVHSIWSEEHALEKGYIKSTKKLERLKAELKALQEEDNRILDELYRREADGHKARIGVPSALTDAMAQSNAVYARLDTDHGGHPADLLVTHSENFFKL